MVPCKAYGSSVTTVCGPACAGAGACRVSVEGTCPWTCNCMQSRSTSAVDEDLPHSSSQRPGSQAVSLTCSSCSAVGGNCDAARRRGLQAENRWGHDHSRSGSGSGVSLCTRERHYLQHERARTLPALCSQHTRWGSYCQTTSPAEGNSTLTG